MSDSASPLDPFPTNADIDETLAEFGGDHRATIAALLRDLAMMAGDYEGSVSKGFVRSAIPSAPRARRLVRR